MGAWYSILVRMQDDDRGVHTTASCVRTLIAEAERVPEVERGRADPEDDMVQRGGQKVGFCGKGLRTVAFTGVEALVCDTLRAGQAPARLGVGVSAKRLGVLDTECTLSTQLAAVRSSLPGGDGPGTGRAVMEKLPALEEGLDTVGTSLLCWPPLMV